ncbi:hypothetical protein [Rhizobium sp. NPDC090279]|uniref:hypothetical protein n=1 Tax=Rhizobium sp. NPDC090279 TaxID=3364499 RepID=UPI00383BCEBA
MSQAGYFDRFWGCPGCFRILSIAEIIELHCEDCAAAVEPMEIAETMSTAETTEQEILP